ncbi:MAG: O-antigen ligase family protein [Bryobacteraceae bacterium]
MSMLIRQHPRTQWAIALTAGCYATAVALMPNWTAAIALILPLVAGPLLFWLLAAPARWIGAFLAAALLLPPLPIEIGNSGPHPALAIAALGIAAGLLRFGEWRFRPDLLTGSLGLFLAVLLASVGMALLSSGFAVGLASLARVFLFAISVYVFLYARWGPGAASPFAFRKALRWLFGAAVAAAAFACVDFYFQFPAPAGYGPQFVWLDTGVFRRAQGLFYEASTLGNFCAFFLIMVANALLRPPADRPLFPRWALIAGGGVLALALILSYSRASVLNCAAAFCMLLFLHRNRVNLRRVAAVGAGCLAGGAILAALLFPGFAELYWMRLSLSAQNFFTATEGILSGRLASWRLLVGFLAGHPWFAVIGVGYKTLPYSDFIGQQIVGDNMYLTLLVETGITGLAALGFLLWGILRASWTAAHHGNPRAAFLGAWLFAFWIGQLVQMLSGDLLTYWRVLPVYFWVLAIAVREADA